MDWTRWITDGIESYTDILDAWREGHVSTFEERCPIFMQQHLDPKTVAKVQSTVSLKTPVSIYQVTFMSSMLMQSLLQLKGWEVSIEPQAGVGYTNIHLISRKKGCAILIELKPSKKLEHILRDASEVLKQIIDKNY